MNIIETLKRLDSLMQGVHEYDSTWINYPDKPEQAPVDLLRTAIKQLEDEAKVPTPDAPEAPVHWDNTQAHAWQSGWETGWEAAWDKAHN
jgi:hypothetical protein